MSITFNSSFNSKISGFSKSAAGKSKLAVATEAEAMAKATEAGQQLAQCVENAISSSGMSGGAIAAVGSVSSTGASPVGSTGMYHIEVHIDAEHRPSLNPGRYGGIADMTELLNEGYSAGAQVFGEWHGVKVGSLVHREGAHFIEHGISDFLGSYSGPCEIVGCSKRA